MDMASLEKRAISVRVYRSSAGRIFRFFINAASGCSNAQRNHTKYQTGADRKISVSQVT